MNVQVDEPHVATDEAPPGGETKGAGLFNLGSSRVGGENIVLLVVLLSLVAIFGIATGGLTVSPVNLTNIVFQSSVTGIAAVGQAFVVLTGGIDISQAGVAVLVSMAGALLLTDGFQNPAGTPISPVLVIPIMLLIGSIVGACSGILVSRVGMPALIVTLGVWQIARGLAFQLGGGASVGSLPDGFAQIGQGSFGGVPVPILLFVFVSVVGLIVLNRTTYGRSVYAVGGNELSAWLSGINTRRIKFSVYVVSAFLASLAAVVMTSRTMGASMRTLEGLELDTIAAVAIGGISLAGGRGSLGGVLLGVLIIGVINNGMSVLGASPAAQGIVMGLIIIGAVGADYRRRQK